MSKSEPVLTPQRTRYLLIAGLILGAFLIGRFFSGGPAQAPDGSAVNRNAAGGDSAVATLWTCAMHPQIKLPNHGKCPICYMDLIPLTSEDDDAASGPAHYSMSETAKKLAEVETAPAVRTRADINVRMFGLVYEDETRAAALTARVDGRLDQVYIDYTGVNVHKGDPMVLIWSKTLLASQVELLESMRGGSSESTYGAEEKLIQQGFTREQVEAIKLTKKTTRDVTLLAPISGVVTRKMAVQGQFVKEGQEMYIINDLSRVWVKLDAYESDLPWIKFGQSVTFTTSAVPGRTFSGRVLFIDPVLDMKTRSVKVRVEADNPEFILKPGMFVTAELKAEVDVKGKVIKSEWAGKYICPLHLGDSVSDTPGVCPDSKVALQPASSFGYSDEPHPQPPLMIPTTAPMITGARSIVYVQTEADKPTYELREVTLGPRAEHGYIVYSGLREGERVVTRGNFKIDSAMQIVGKPSMMSGDLSPAAGASSDEETVEKITAPAAFLQSLTPVLQRYDELKSALAAEDAKAAAEAATKMSAAVNSAKAALLTGKAVKSWRKMQGTLNGYLKSFAEQKDVAAQRKVFDPLSENLGRGLLAFRHALPHPVYLFHCEDVGRKGAYWIEMSKEARNPYLPKSACADLVETIPPENAPPAAATQPAHTH